MSAVKPRDGSRNQKSRKIKRRPVVEPGCDGAKLVSVANRQTKRCLPGTFEWRYGRKSADIALYEAGTLYARLWEAAGAADARSPDYAGAGGFGQWKGVAEVKVEAMKKIGAAMREVGLRGSALLTDYCVHGLTSAQIGQKHLIAEREVAPVLHDNLRACAVHFKLLSRQS